MKRFIYTTTLVALLASVAALRTMNRTEYVATIKSLVGVDVNAKDILPQDIQVEGFDNVAAALSVSPSSLDQYINAARQVAKLAVGSPIADLHLTLLQKVGVPREKFGDSTSVIAGV